MKDEPIGVLAAVAMATTQLLHAYAPEMPAELVSAIGVVVVAVARQFVKPLHRHYEAVTAAIGNAKAETRQQDDPRGPGAGAAAAAVLCLALLAAACAPPQPLDSAERIEQAHAAGHAEAMSLARRCLADPASETDRAVLVCIFGDAEVAAAPDRSPSRAELLRDQAVDAVGGIVGAFGRRGAAEIEGR